ncbi:Jasmonate-induced oxygenase 1 [Dionaea muscipula]
MNCLQGWPEPIVRVQSLSESGLKTIPNRYVKPPTERPLVAVGDQVQAADEEHINIPEIDLGGLMLSGGGAMKTMRRISEACREWGFFQVVNHGVAAELMDRAREVWREFFHLPMEVKQRYANSPTTYEGYGSRLGVEKGAILDWSDYFFLHYLPFEIKNHTKWPAQPPYHRYTHMIPTTTLYTYIYNM